mmetsp:Transcript_97173/g.217475  ORF Transcript_97173/g.217475 Transcript_97173/m.217475 type:complete len:237 (-) Transcript_97173:448-1158(-)
MSSRGRRTHPRRGCCRHRIRQGWSPASPGRCRCVSTHGAGARSGPSSASSAGSCARNAGAGLSPAAGAPFGLRSIRRWRWQRRFWWSEVIVDREAVPVGTPVEEPLRKLRHALKSCEVLHSHVVLVKEGDLGSVVDETRYDLVTAGIHGTEQGRLAELVHAVHRVAPLYEELGQRQVAIVGSLVQRCAALIVRMVHRGFPVYKEPHDVLMVLPGRLPQCCAEEGLLTEVKAHVRCH